MLLNYCFDSCFLEAEKGGTSSSKIHIFAEILQKHCQKSRPHIYVGIIDYFFQYFILSPHVSNICLQYYHSPGEL